jgi:signal transduction histidine kinase
MLHQFLTVERDSILTLAKSSAYESQGVVVSSVMQEGWSLFYSELIGLMERNEPFAEHREKGIHTRGAEDQGKEYLRLGYTISEVVHSYGIICQAITATATERGFAITSREFQQLNLSLDTAIAEAVTEYDKLLTTMSDRAEIMRLGDLARELRNALQNATIALELIEAGNVGVRSSTGGVLNQSLRKMGTLVDISMTEVRLRLEPKLYALPVRLITLMSEVGITAGYAARSREITLKMTAPPNLQMEVDRQLFVAALANLVENAVKFSTRGSEIAVRGARVEDRVIVRIEDSCGGLRDDRIQMLLSKEIDQHENVGEGLGIRISKLAIERNGGSLRVEDLPGKGCALIIDLPWRV